MSLIKNLFNARIVRRSTDGKTLWVSLPRASWVPIAGGCSCTWCPPEGGCYHLGGAQP